MGGDKAQSCDNARYQQLSCAESSILRGGTIPVEEVVAT
jgi:hypothetical protein